MTVDVTIGHNRPPADCILRAGDLVETANRWLAERPVLKSEEEAKLCDSYIGQLRDSRADLIAARNAERAPHEAALAAVNERYADPCELVEIALRRILPLATDWLQRLRDKQAAERARLQAEADAAKRKAEQLQAEAERAGAPVQATLAAERAEEAAAKAASAAKWAPTKARVKGEYSDRAMSLHGYWSARIADEDKALAHYRDNEEVRAAALAACLKIAKRQSRRIKDAAAAPPGVVFFVKEQAV